MIMKIERSLIPVKVCVCKNCGAKIKDKNAKICPKCKAPLFFDTIRS